MVIGKDKRQRNFQQSGPLHYVLGSKGKDSSGHQGVQLKFVALIKKLEQVFSIYCVI
jgi:hypothetical protein